VNILLVEDSPTDALMAREALRDLGIEDGLYTVSNGEAAMDFLRRRAPYESAPLPALILLDLDLPKKTGQEILAEIKSDDELRTIAVVVLTSSRAEADLRMAWSSSVNGYIVKPGRFTGLVDVLGVVRDFWLNTVTLPGHFRARQSFPQARK